MSFRFRQFVIDDSRCAMKVGTDGVLLGAWAQVGHARHILDVGTGSGLVAIMLAQRFPSASITGIDISDEAVLQAESNMLASPWATRLQVAKADFLTWETPVDAIVCNPPFFQSSLRCPDAGRTTARHDDTLPLHRLAIHAEAILMPQGTLTVILPADTQFCPPTLALRRRCMIQTVEGKAPKRKLLEYVKGKVEAVVEERLLLTSPDGKRSAGHLNLTRDFYL